MPESVCDNAGKEWFQDKVIPPSPDAQHFHRDIAGSRLVLFPGMGHMVQEENPAASLVPVREFLSTVDRGIP
jgi:pimeloyl-ACP methyl ester carboxylesterase